VAVASASHTQICTSSIQIPHQHPTTQFSTGPMPFLPLNQQRLSTEEYNSHYIENSCHNDRAAAHDCCERDRYKYQTKKT